MSFPVAGSVTGVAAQAQRWIASVKCSTPEIAMGRRRCSAVPIALVPIASSIHRPPGCRWSSRPRSMIRASPTESVTTPEPSQSRSMLSESASRYPARPSAAFDALRSRMLRFLTPASSSSPSHGAAVTFGPVRASRDRCQDRSTTSRRLGATSPSTRYRSQSSFRMLGVISAPSCTERLGSQTAGVNDSPRSIASRTKAERLHNPAPVNRSACSERPLLPCADE